MEDRFSRDSIIYRNYLSVLTVGITQFYQSIIYIISTYKNVSNGYTYWGEGGIGPK